MEVPLQTPQTSVLSTVLRYCQAEHLAACRPCPVRRCHPEGFVARCGASSRRSKLWRIFETPRANGTIVTAAPAGRAAQSAVPTHYLQGRLACPDITLIHCRRTTCSWRLGRTPELDIGEACLVNLCAGSRSREVHVVLHFLQILIEPQTTQGNMSASILSAISWQTCLTRH